ncbi:hypothetical protein FHS46_000757 [Variibacter gotjawalensis]|nr:hypothetical protein [Variibacter gotjawalensis]RZS48350.1 hypothetical protein EV661_0760 [Variibacter gotjawalensis]
MLRGQKRVKLTLRRGGHAIEKCYGVAVWSVMHY